MAFNLDQWQEDVRKKLSGFGERLAVLRKAYLPKSVYGLLGGLSVWPLLEAAQGGELLPMMMTLGRVADGIGGNLIAEQVQRWRDASHPVDERHVAGWVTEQTENADLREAINAIIVALDTLRVAREGLTAAEREWLRTTLQQELQEFAGHDSSVALLLEDGAVFAYGQGAKAAGAASLVADTVTAHNVIVGTQIVQQAETASRDTDTLERRYLRRLLVVCNALPLAVVDPLAVEKARERTMDLLSVYVSLDTATQVVEGEDGKPGRASARGTGRSSQAGTLTVISPPANSPLQTVLTLSLIRFFRSRRSSTCANAEKTWHC